MKKSYFILPILFLFFLQATIPAFSASSATAKPSAQEMKISQKLLRKQAKLEKRLAKKEEKPKNRNKQTLMRLGLGVLFVVVGAATTSASVGIGIFFMLVGIILSVLGLISGIKGIVEYGKQGDTTRQFGAVVATFLSGMLFLGGLLAMSYSSIFL